MLQWIVDRIHVFGKERFLVINIKRKRTLITPYMSRDRGRDRDRQ